MRVSPAAGLVGLAVIAVELAGCGGTRRQSLAEMLVFAERANGHSGRSAACTTPRAGQHLCTVEESDGHIRKVDVHGEAGGNIVITPPSPIVVVCEDLDRQLPTIYQHTLAGTDPRLFQVTLARGAHETALAITTATAHLETSAARLQLEASASGFSRLAEAVGRHDSATTTIHSGFGAFDSLSLAVAKACRSARSQGSTSASQP